MIPEAEAVAAARRLAAERGWAWVDPAAAALHRRWFGPGGRWVVFSNAAGFGPKVRVELDARTGDVLDAGYVPR